MVRALCTEHKLEKHGGTLKVVVVDWVLVQNSGVLA